MKPTSAVNKAEMKLKRRLVFVRTSIRELTATQLADVKGGRPVESEVGEPLCPPFYTY